MPELLIQFVFISMFKNKIKQGYLFTFEFKIQ